MPEAALRPARWRNWLGNETCRATWAEPRGLDELASTVASAAGRGQVRCVGRGTAWSGLVATTGTLVSTARLTRVLDLRLEDREPSVLVEAGVSVRTLTDLLARHGHALIGPTMFRDVTIAGAVATGSHGLGFEAGTLADSVIELTLVDAGGGVHRWTRDTPAMLALARVSLGLLGAVHSVRLRVRPTFAVWVDQYTWPFEQLVAGLDDLARSYDYVQFMWFPQAGHAVVKGMRRVDDVPPPGDQRARYSRLLHVVASTVHPALARWTPGLVPPMLRVASRITDAARSWLGDPQVEFHLPDAPRAWAMAFGVPMDTLAAALEAAAEVARWRRRRCGDGPTFPFFARMVGASDAPLAASYGRATCFLESAMCAGSRDVAAYFDRLEAELLALPGVRPHWAKYMRRPDGALARIAGIDEFRRLRDVLDPGHRFTNDFCERLLRAPERPLHARGEALGG
jgi:L-gulonolactone oxidase